ISFGQKIKYKDCKNDYSTKHYQYSIDNQKYSPLVAGILNYLIPSTGYYYIGEPLRGVCVIGGELITGSVFFSGLIMSMSVDSETGRSSNSARTVMYSGLITTGLIQIWSIYDVIKITKIKNLAYQENNLAVKVQPNLYFANIDNSNTAIYGLRLTINF
ncbi:MAG: hypothetical protein U9R54_04460, partial [Bacteroidota bacterium]|nr:hypothetical protein [Bacteroidota bacterium]